eukprot:282829-Prorocentrum_minimum.AAC.1
MLSCTQRNSRSRALRSPPPPPPLARTPPSAPAATRAPLGSAPRAIWRPPASPRRRARARSARAGRGRVGRSENQSQEGRRYIPSTQTNHRRGGGRYLVEDGLAEGPSARHLLKTPQEG